MRSLVLTLGAALVATAIALVLGIPFAYLLARQPFPGRGIVESVIDLPVVLPHTATGIALLTVYWPEVSPVACSRLWGSCSPTRSPGSSRRCCS